MSSTPTVAAALPAATAPGLLADRARRDPEGVAFRAKHLGLYEERTWREYGDLVARCALGFEALGLVRAEPVTLLGDVSEEVLVSEMAAQAVGAATCALGPSAADAEVEDRLRNCGAAICVAGDSDCVERVLSAADGLPALQSLVAVDPSAPSDSGNLRQMTFAALLSLGGERLAASGKSGLETLERFAAGLSPDATACLLYPDTASGRSPEGKALLSHARQLGDASALVRQHPLLGHPNHRTVAYLPLSNAMGRAAAVTLPLLSGVVPHFGESPEDLVQTLFEVAPTVWFSLPKHLEKFASQIQEAIGNTSRLKGKAYGWATAAGRRSVDRGTSASVFDRGLHRLLHRIALRPVLNKIGFDQLELVVTGGEPLTPEARELWQIYGLPVVES